MKNRITEVRKQQGFTSRQLAEIVGTSPSQMSRLEQSKRKLSLEWILRLSGALKVPASELVGIDLGNPVPDACDHALMGTVIGFLFEAADRYKAKPSPSQFGSWISFVYNNAVKERLKFPQIRELADTIIKVNLGAKPEPLVTDIDEPKAKETRTRGPKKRAGRVKA